MIDVVYIYLFFGGFIGTIAYCFNKDNQKKAELGNIIKEYSIIQNNSQIPV